MGTPARPPQVVHFADYVLNLQTAELCRNGTKSILPDQPFQILAKLIEFRGRLVTREELTKTLWPPGTFVDFDQSLNKAVARLREALGDDVEHPRFVETLPRKGYRFIAECEPENGVPAEPLGLTQDEKNIFLLRNEFGRHGRELEHRETLPGLSDQAADSVIKISEAYTQRRTQTLPPLSGPGTNAENKTLLPATDRRGPKEKLLIVVLVLTAVGLIGGWQSYKNTVTALGAYLFRPAPAPAKVIGYTQITHDGHQKSFDGQVTATVLTDGPRLFVQESIDGRFSIAQVPASGGETVPLSTPLQNVALYNISTDRSELLVGSFFRTESELSLWGVPVLGGLPRRLGTTGADAIWMPNGNLLLARDNRLILVPKNGEAPRTLAELPGLPYWLRWSPDKSSLRFTVQGHGNEGLSIWEMSSQGTNLHRILSSSDVKNPSRGNWTADGKYFVFQASYRGGLDIWAIREKHEWFYGASNKPVQLTFGPLRFHSPQPSIDGNKIFVVGELRRAELQRYDQGSHQFLPYLGGISAEGVTFSRDGLWAVYSSYPDYGLWRSRVDGTDRLQLWSAPPYVAMPRWSPDGGEIACIMGESGKPWEIVLIPKDGGNPRVVYQTHSAIDRPTWMPDGNVLAFGEFNDPYSTSELLKLLDLKTEQVTILPGSEGMSLPVLSPDGQYLAAVNADGKKLRLFDFATSSWSDLASMSIGFIEWSPDGKFIYLDGGTGNNAGLYRLRLSDRSMHRLVGTKDFERAASGWTPWIGITPEGAPLLVRDRGAQEIYALDFAAP